MDGLKHRIIEIVKGERSIGGIKLAGLANRIIAEHASNGEYILEADIKQAVWDLLSVSALDVTADMRLVTPKEAQPKQSAPGTAFPVTDGTNPSGIYPIGIGDPLYNAAGQQVATVIGMRKERAESAFGFATMVVLQVQANFTNFWANDGTHIPGGAGEVLAGKPDLNANIQDWVQVQRSFDQPPTGASKKTMK